MGILTSTDQQSGLGLDVGTKRIGVAVANLGVRFARPLTTLEQPETFIEDIIRLILEEDAAWIVLGLPRGLDGQETAQTVAVQAFGVELAARLQSSHPQVPLYWIDEALTSHKAEQELAARGKSYAKAEVDALAAAFILEDYLQTLGGQIRG